METNLRETLWQLVADTGFFSILRGGSGSSCDETRGTPTSIEIKGKKSLKKPVHVIKCQY